MRAPRRFIVTAMRVHAALCSLSGESPVELLIVQHAEIPHLRGNPGLTRQGMEHAAAIGRWLHRQRPIDVLYSSPIRRARETAVQIAAECGKNLNDVHIDHRLRERTGWDGEAMETNQTYLEEWKASFQDRDVRLGGGESSREAGERFVDFVQEMRDRHGDQRIVVVGHGGVTLDMALTLWGEANIRRRSPTIFNEGPMPCSVTRIQTLGEHLVLYSIGTQYMLR
jgi:2,3-bisphosphoglycerate-dependent phosphoglycerate mutase